MMSKINSNLGWRHLEPISLIVSCLMLVSLVAFTGCASSKPNSTSNSLSYVSKSLPAWVVGEFKIAHLNVTGGQPPYTWKVKDGSQLPKEFTLGKDGSIGGDPLPLPSGTTKQTSPPFTIIVTDTTGQSKEIELRVTIVSSESQVSTGKPTTSKTAQIGHWLYTLYSVKRSGSSLTVNLGITNVASTPLGWSNDVASEFKIMSPGFVCVDSYNQPFVAEDSSWYEFKNVYPTETIKGKLKYKLSDYSGSVSLYIGQSSTLFSAFEFSLYSPEFLFDLD